MRSPTLLAAVLVSLAACAPRDDRPESGEGYRISAEPLSLTVYAGTPADTPIWTRIAEETNIRIRFLEPTGGTWEDSRTALELAIASGAAADLYLGDRDQLNLHGEAGALRDLGELARQYAPNVTRYLLADPDTRDQATSFTGKLFVIPRLGESAPRYAFFLRQDWLDRLGLEAPRTIEQWLLTLRAFRDRDPNENGRADEVPYFTREKLVGIWTFAYAFDADFNWRLRDGVPVYGPVEPEFRDFLEFVSRLYREGLLDNQYLTRTPDVLDDLLASDTGGATSDWIRLVTRKATQYAQVVPGLRMTAVLPPYIPGRSRPATRMQTPTVDTVGMAISVNNPHPVESIRLLDYLYSDHGSELLSFGIQDTHWRLEGGRHVFTPETLAHPDGPFAALAAAGAGGFPYRVHPELGSVIAAIDPATAAVEDMYRPIMDRQFPPLKYLATELERVYPLYAAMEAYKEDVITKLILGVEPMSSFDTFVSRIQELGLDEVNATVRAAWERRR